MADREVFETDQSITNGRPLARSYIAQKDKEFAQFMANLIASMDEIVNSNETPAGVKVNAAKEMRYQIETQMKLMEMVQAKQDRAEAEADNQSLRKLIVSNPTLAMEQVNANIQKLMDLRDLIQKFLPSQPKAITDGS